MNNKYDLRKCEKGIHKIMVILECFLLIAMCIGIALPNGYYADFYPINGTFQNYNPCRRFLSGQIPGRDFTDYLGMGHMYSGSLLTWLFGGNYNDSQKAFALLSILSLALLIAMIAAVVFKGKMLVVVSITNLTLVILHAIHTGLLKLPFTSEYYEDFEQALQTCFWVGNSARFIRALILPITTIVLLISLHLFQKKEETILHFRHKKLIFLGGIACVAGCAFLWSNDYGLGCWICLTIFTFWIVLSRSRSFWKALLSAVGELGLSLIWVAILGTVFTRGNLGLWLRTFFTADKYQSWYYTSPKSYYLYDIELYLPCLLQAVLSIMYLILVFYHHGSANSILRFGLLGFLNMCCFAVVNEYKLLSGGRSIEFALCVFVLTCTMEVLCLIIKIVQAAVVRARLNDRIFNKSTRVILVASAVAVSSVAVVSQFEIIYKNVTATPKEGVYIEEMGGYLQGRGTDLQNTHVFLSGESFWSTYSSGQEVMENIFNPSKNDYIIHVLSDDAREQYLKDFHEQNFRYVSTINKSFNSWQYWVERANWFFFRELYRNWHPMYYNQYSTYWERNTSGESVIESKYECEISENENGETVINIHTDPSVSGIADVYIDYEVARRKNHSIWLFNPMLYVQSCAEADGWTNEEIDLKNTFMRAKSVEYIPIVVEKGEGTIILNPLPNADTELVINEIRCKETYPVVKEYVGCQSIEGKADKITFGIENNVKQRNNISDAKNVRFWNKTFPVENISFDESKIYITVASNGFVVPQYDLATSANIIEILR